MQSAVPLGDGAMSAVLGLDMDAVKSICAEAEAGEICSPANFNSPGQIVISGSAGAVKRAGTLARERGASKVIPLKVSAPFHCALMRPVADKLQEEFSSIGWKAPVAPIMANVDAEAKYSVDSIRPALYEQTYKPVLWADGVAAMAAEGVELFGELGPGSVLSGLVKRTVKGKTTFCVNKIGDIGKVAELLGGTAS
jgi:[acyl-carrier-protein] S-malonyltransferase